MIGLEGGRGRPRILSNCLLPRNHEGNLMSAIKYPRDTMGTFKERRNKRRNEVRLARNATMKEVRSILLRITTRLLLHRIREIRLWNEYLFREKLAGKYTRVRGRKDGEKKREKRCERRKSQSRIELFLFVKSWTEVCPTFDKSITRDVVNFARSVKNEVWWKKVKAEEPIQPSLCFVHFFRSRRVSSLSNALRSICPRIDHPLF